MSARVYLIEDEPSIALGVQDNLELEGYSCRVFDTGDKGLSACLDESPDLLILDLGLPGMDGLDVLGQLREAGKRFPVLVLTARSSEVDVLKGFRRGADDYVTKPFSPRILLARVAALLARAKPGDDLLYLGKVTLNRRTMAVDGVHLTTREIQVLTFLADAAGQPVSRLTLLEEIWGMDSNSSERAVDTMILELRKKIEPTPARPVYLLTQRGVGYKLSDQVFVP